MNNRFAWILLIELVLIVNAVPVRAEPAETRNIVYFLVDNLGYGELGCYGGGVLRGSSTPRLDDFAKQGMKLLNFAPETQYTPSRSALMTGRYSIRSGNHTVALAGDSGGLVAWEKTMGDVLSEHGYATCCMGKWHIGASDGRWPTDDGFDEWYGIPHSYDECLWAEDNAEGVLFTVGGRFNGMGFYLINGKPTFDYNYLDLKRTTLAASSSLSPGQHAVLVKFNYSGEGVGQPADVELIVDGKPVATSRIEKTIPIRVSLDETLYIGEDTGTPVSEDYEVPFEFTGEIEEVVVELK